MSNDDNILKKVLLAGVGLAATAKDKLAEASKDLMDKGDSASSEYSHVLDEMADRGKEATKDVLGKVKDAIDDFGGACQDDDAEDVVVEPVRKATNATAEAAEETTTEETKSE